MPASPHAHNLTGQTQVERSTAAAAAAAAASIAGAATAEITNPDEMRLLIQTVCTSSPV
jgi:hypothetical protein